MSSRLVVEGERCSRRIEEGKVELYPSERVCILKKRLEMVKVGRKSDSSFGRRPSFKWFFPFVTAEYAVEAGLYLPVSLTFQSRLLREGTWGRERLAKNQRHA